MEVNHEIPKSLVNRDSLPLNLPRRPPDVLITSSSAGAKGAGRPNHAATSTLPHVIIPHHDSSPALVQGSTDDQAIPDPNGDSNGHRVAPEPNKRALYVGGLDSRVTEEMLRQIFETSGHVQNVKVITDRTAVVGRGNYGFVEFDDPGAAERALLMLNGRQIHGREIRVNWAYQVNQTTKEDTSSHHHIFVGDLSNEVNDERLLQAFSVFGVVSEARVMWDMKTGRSRGYGFVSYRERHEADKAIAAMDGEWLGSRAIRCNWANQKGQTAGQQPVSMVTSIPTYQVRPGFSQQAYEAILAQTPSWQTTCYIGNIAPSTTEQDIVPLFSQQGLILEKRFQSDRGFAFLKMDTHEHAASAIALLNGYIINDRPIKCSWGKDRLAASSPTSTSTTYYEGYSPHQPHTPAYPPSPASFYPHFAASPTYLNPQLQSPQSAHSLPGMINNIMPMTGPNTAPQSPYGLHNMPMSAGAYGRTTVGGSLPWPPGNNQAGYTHNFHGF